MRLIEFDGYTMDPTAVNLVGKIQYFQDISYPFHSKIMENWRVLLVKFYNMVKIDFHVPYLVIYINIYTLNLIH